MSLEPFRVHFKENGDKMHIGLKRHCRDWETGGTTWLNKAPEGFWGMCGYMYLCVCVFVSSKILWEVRHGQLRLENCFKHIHLLPTSKSCIYMVDESMAP